jgi:pimeloyl-ACP methyl ester carboxylesterase
MGSYLKSKNVGSIWWIDVRTRKYIDSLKLAPNGEEDADSDFEIMPCSTDPSYDSFTFAVLRQNDFGLVPFPYDWRKPLDLSTDILRDTILETYEKNGKKAVHLVAHSMGGLLVRATLMNYGQQLWSKVGKIVFIGTPHYGSPAIASYLKNHLWGSYLMALLGRYITPETFRSLWGALSLLPAPTGIYPGTRKRDRVQWTSEDPDDSYIHPCINFDMYQADNWKLNLSPPKTSELQQVLDGALDFHQRMYQDHMKLDQRLRDRMVVIAGVGFKTLFRIANDYQFFGLWEHMTKVTERIPGNPHQEGDGSVPLASAALEYVGEIHYVREFQIKDHSECGS